MAAAAPVTWPGVEQEPAQRCPGRPTYPDTISSAPAVSSEREARAVLAAYLAAEGIADLVSRARPEQSLAGLMVTAGGAGGDAAAGCC